MLKSVVNSDKNVVNCKIRKITLKKCDKTDILYVVKKTKNDRIQIVCKMKAM